MKKLNKLMAIGLSLVMCAGMIAPAFADNAYFYIKDGDAGWEFAGKGEVTGSVEFNEENKAVNAVNDDGTLNTDVVIAPTGDSEGMQTTPGYGQVPKDWWPHDMQTVPVEVKVDTSKVDTLIKQENLNEGGTEYVYDTSNGTDDVLDNEYTYSVTWEVKKENGADAYVDEITKTTSGGILGGIIGGTTTYSGNSVPETGDSKKIELVGGEGTEQDPIKNDIHVDAKVEKSTNTQVTVVVKDFKDGSQTEGTTYGQDDSLYVRESAVADETRRDAAVDSAAETITSKLDAEVKNVLTDDNYDTDVVEQDGQLVKTYSEKTYTVTYEVSGAEGVSGLEIPTEETKGKVSEAWDRLEETLIGNTLSNIGAAGGYYSFSRWVSEVDADGNVTLKAVCTFNPYYYDYDLGDTDVTIDDQAVPLAAGPVTRAQFIDYLWRHEGEPDSEGVCTFTDVEDTHEYFDALCWAEENGVAEAYLDAEGHEDGTFEPDELVTVAAVREFLDNFAGVFGTNAVTVAELTTLTGEDGEAVLNCDQVLAEFFGEEYELPEDLDALETDDAA